MRGEAATRRSEEGALMRRGRLVALVMAGTMAAWIALQWIGGALGLPIALAIVLDLAALTVFAWALVNTYRIWRRRREMRG
jgi:hypothetical protein